MQSKTVVFGLFAVIAVTGTATAATLTSFGSIQDMATVTGPTLYATPATTLQFNQKPDHSTAYNLSGSGLSFDLQTLSTQQLNGSDVYPMQLTLHAEARLNRTGSEPLQIQFGLYNASGAHDLCTDRVTVSGTDYTTYTASCIAPASENVDRFYYRFTEQTGKQNVSYHILADGTTRVEVTDQ